MITFTFIKTFIDGAAEESPFFQAPDMAFLLSWVDNMQAGIEAHCDVSYKIIGGVE